MLFGIRMQLLLCKWRRVSCKPKIHRILLFVQDSILLAKLYKQTMLIICYFLITLFAYFYLNNFLQKYQNKIEHLALQDIQQALEASPILIYINKTLC